MIRKEGGENEFIPGNVGVKITNGYVSQEISPFVWPRKTP